MTNQIMLEIENLGSINKADLDIKKLNVIVGANCTGKSASSRFLFCLLTALSKERIYLANTDIKNRLKQVCYLLKFNYFDEKSFKSKDLKPVEDLINKTNSHEMFDEILHKLYDLSDKINSNSLKEMYLSRLKRIDDLIKINKNRDLQYVKTFNSLLDSEYSYCLKKDTHVIFKGSDGKNQTLQKIPIKENPQDVKIDNEFYNYLNFDNVVYIDSLSLLEFDNGKSFGNIEDTANILDDNIAYHIRQLERKLKNTSKDIYDGDFYKEVDEFREKIDDMIGGKFKYDRQNNRFLLKKDGETYTMQNTSSGVKHLGIIQLLMENRELTQNSFLILDEPEIHLHPWFQVQFAEILVLMAEKLNITVYINTHSPFFAEAIEAYSRYYNLADDMSFYLTEKSEIADKYNYNLLDRDEIIEVYDNLGNPFDIIRKVKLKAR